MVLLYIHYIPHHRSNLFRCFPSKNPSFYSLRSLNRGIVVQNITETEAFGPFYGIRLALPLYSYISPLRLFSSSNVVEQGCWSHQHVDPCETHTIRCKLMQHTGNAYDMPDEMPIRASRSYNTLIRSYTSNRQCSEALSVFYRMQGAGFRPDCYGFAAVIKSCAVVPDARLRISIHGFAVKGGYSTIAAVAKALMDMYARFGALCDSCRLFGEMGQRDSVSWNVLLSGYAHSQLFIEAMALFHSMHVCDEEEVKPTSITISVILPICAKLRILKQGQSIHAYTVKTGLELETLVGNALVSMYAKCGCVMEDAHTVFHLIAYKDVISWNSMIAGYTENGFFDEAFGLFCQMVLMGMPPNYATIANVLPICAIVEHRCQYGKEIHCYVLRSALEMDVSVCNALMSYYSKVGGMKVAESVFSKMHSRDLVSWNTIIAGYVMNGWHFRALELFHKLLLTGMEPDSVTLLSTLSACAQLHEVQKGRKIHDYVLRYPTLYQDTSVGNALISFYGKCGELDVALWTFLGMSRKDLISWNAMLAIYADYGQEKKFFDLLNQMNEEGIEPDSVTILSILQVCAFLGMRKVREAHGYSLRAGFTSYPTVGNAILDAYAKCGDIDSASRTFRSLTGKNVISGNTMISGYLQHGCQEDAEIIFDQMSERDLTTWNLMVQVYAQNNCTDRAFILFRELQYKGVSPDMVSLVSILVACARLASVHLVRQCHGYAIRASLDNLHLEGALLDTYSKCGSISDAYTLFRTSSQKDLITFTAMVGGFAMHGMAEEALGIFCQMLELDIKADHVILTALLSACSHAGLINEGWKHFKSIDEIHSIKPTMEHYACMVDLLARKGRLREAYDFIVDMPCEANANVWGTLLGACKIHGEVEIGRLVADHLFDVEAGNIGNYVVMSNIYAADGKWDGVEQVRRLMKTKDLKKPAGCSWIEVQRTSHVFVAGDLSHPLRPFIYNTLKTLDEQIKEPLVQRN